MKNRNFFTSSLPFLLIAFSLCLFSCNPEEETIIPENEDACWVEIDGTFEQVVLDEMPIYLDGGEGGFNSNYLEEINYPAEARENGTEGTVILEYEITQLGTVININIIQDIGGGSGDEAKAALGAITEGVSFSPGILDGEPVDVKKEIDVQFRLE